MDTGKSQEVCTNEVLLQRKVRCFTLFCVLFVTLTTRVMLAVFVSHVSDGTLQRLFVMSSQ